MSVPSYKAVHGGSGVLPFTSQAKSGSGVPPLSPQNTKRQDAASTITPEQLAWLHLIPNSSATRHEL